MKTYNKYLLKLFSNSFSKVFLIFFGIILIINIIEQIDFFKKIDVDFYFPIFLSLLNAPSIVFELLPFIFMISTQIIFIKLIDNNELEIFKYSGVTNHTLIKLISIFSLIVGFICIIFFYNFSSVLKKTYIEIKNNYSNDNKYLAVITENGLWIKDETNEGTNIIDAKKIDGFLLLDVSITQLDKKFELVRIIQSKKVNISNKEWLVLMPKISIQNNTFTLDSIKLNSNFDLEKINSLFSQLSTLSIIELFELRSSYKSLNYSIIEIDSHLYKIISYPFYLTLLVVLSSIIMFNIGYRKNLLFRIIFGILLSVIIYYINYFFNILGTSEKIPLTLSIFLPLIILSIINITSIIKINEK